MRPLGFEIIETSATGAFPGEIEGLGTLAIKRAKVSAEEFIQGEPLVDDICFVLTEDGEEVPEGYVSLDREITSEKDHAPGGGKWTGGAANNRTARSNSTTTGKVILAYHQRPSMGLCDLRYESCTLDRYPQKVNNHCRTNHWLLPYTLFMCTCRYHCSERLLLCSCFFVTSIN